MTPESSMSRVYTDFSSLAKLHASAKAESPEAVKAVAKEFESSFVEMMMKSLRDASQSEGLLDNDASRMYQDMFDKQIAVDISERGDMGIAQMIEKQLTKGQQFPPVKPVVEGVGTTAQNPFNVTGLHTNKPAPVLTLNMPERRDIQPKPIIDLNQRTTAMYEPSAQRKQADRIVNLRQPEKTRFVSPEEFIETLRPHAELAAQEIGVDPDLLIAQAALETGWGKKVMRNPDGSSSYNLFGIKADRSWQGDSVKVASLEYRNGVARREISPFRSYSSFSESFQDYVNFIKEHPRYDKAIEQADNRRSYIHALQKAGYATDPNYANKVINILERKSLQTAWKGSA